ncbi:MAG: 5-formyltetrahydrofolate cyclo-ligase [Paracoccaceae bacterium]|nr:5-formyltetrahydrofolate cyclo-ligase [Paracoccaceae bacterium]MDG1739778.1 5-formyltetrahydrofolate cyclo-ligase [Paracoccaceae bacterium]MDG2257833.1 5-formyltetrahydrofolate cyclo-ligase [Paracoccaceae bacterium]
MNDLAAIKDDARKAAFARRKEAFQAAGPGQAAILSEVLAGYRGVPLAGYMPIRTEISPLNAMAEAAAYGPVGVPVIRAAGQPLWFSKWEPDCEMVDGPFGASVPKLGEEIVPEILIVPLVSFDRKGGRLGYGGGFYDRTIEGLRALGPVLAIGYAFGAQEFADLPLENTDQPLNMVITENEVISTKRV